MNEEEDSQPEQTYQFSDILQEEPKKPDDYNRISDFIDDDLVQPSLDDTSRVMR